MNQIQPPEEVRAAARKADDDIRGGYSQGPSGYEVAYAAGVGAGRAQAAEESDYEYLRDRIIRYLNPIDQDMAEPWIMADAVERAAEFITAQPCLCTQNMIDDYESCARCAALGKRGDKDVKS